MTGTPLLLSTIAAVYFQGKRLPERRADLHFKAIDLLLERRFGPRAGGSEALKFRRLLTVGGGAYQGLEPEQGVPGPGRGRSRRGHLSTKHLGCGGRTAWRFEGLKWSDLNIRSRASTSERDQRSV